MAKKKKQEAGEKHFVVSFSKLYNAPRQKRAYRAIRHLKRFAFKHLRISEENVSVSRALNEALWARGREHIPRKIEIKVVKDKEKAGVYLKGEKVEKPKKEKEKKAKEEKKPEKKEEKEREEEIERKKEEKKAKEKAAEATAIKRGTGKGK